ncbi:MAG: 50S ribosomal protein L3 [Thermodesulfobacteriota bacterium]|nr:50S ribosomal protein L3 [Thermodesulfobacteriota bacterium]
MEKVIIGKKLGMTQIFVEDKIVPVTVIEAEPNRVIYKKEKNQDSYNAVVLGYSVVKPKKLTKPLRGQFEKRGLPLYRYMREFRVSNIDDYEDKQIIAVDIFKPGDYVDVVGTSKGKGFQGVIKRWNFSGGPNAHGSMFHRAPGSIGASAYPARVFKGRKLPGHTGNQRVTLQNLLVIDVRVENNLILVKGAVPGSKNSLVFVRSSLKKSKNKEL